MERKTTNGSGSTKCLIDDCWQTAKVRGFCQACYSWQRWITHRGMRELGNYVQRLHRFASRAEALDNHVVTPGSALHARRRAAA